TCKGALGLMSRNAMVFFDSATTCAGISPARILQNTQSEAMTPLYKRSRLPRRPLSLEGVADTSEHAGLVGLVHDGFRSLLTAQSRKLGEQLALLVVEDAGRLDDHL